MEGTYFCAFLGNKEGLASWKSVCEVHARWVGLDTEVYLRELDGARVLAFCYMGKRCRGEVLVSSAGWEDSQPLLVSTTGAKLSSRDYSYGNLIVVRLALRPEAEIQVTVPPCTPEQFYWSEDRRGVMLSNDFRLHVRWSGLDIDERAVFALLHWEAIPAPLTLSRSCARVPGGHSVTVTVGAPPKLQPVERFVGWSGTGRDDLKRRFLATLDRLLESLPKDPVLCFSGGVDSSLLACRLAVAGRTDVTLVNYAFSDDDPEAEVASEIAGILGLRYERVGFDRSRLRVLLENLAVEYSYPYGDTSAIPTFDLVAQSLCQAQPQVAVEGTGADGLFGVALQYRKYAKLYSLPSALRRLAGSLYELLKAYFWGSRVSRAEAVCGKARLSVALPLLHAALVNIPLDGIAYDVPENARRTITDMLTGIILAMGESLTPQEQLTLADLVHLCSGQFSAKTFDPCRRRGVWCIYPFMEPSVLRLGFAMDSKLKYAGGVPKALLKRLLEDHIPKALIYRPKSGFLPPHRRIFADGEMIDFLRAYLLARDSVMLPFCRTRFLRKAIERAALLRPMSLGVYKFLWAAGFTAAWVKQLTSSVGTPPKVRTPD